MNQHVHSATIHGPTDQTSETSRKIDPSTAAQGPRQSMRHRAMGADFTFTLYGAPQGIDREGLSSIAETVFEELDAIERRVSSWSPDSSTSIANRLAAIKPVKVDADVLALLETSRRVHAETGGAFDVTIGPLMDLWRLHAKKGVAPSTADLRRAAADVGLEAVQVDAIAGTVKFLRPGVRLDFGGIGKGLALDRARAMLRERGVRHALLHSGTSTVVAMGSPPNRRGWLVRVRHPLCKPDTAIDEVLLSDEAMSTSANYEKSFEIDGRSYGHILDPRTGRPAAGLLSASVIASTAVESDALSTAFFVMGRAGVESYCRAHPKVRAILIVPDGERAKPLRLNFDAK